VRGGNRNGPRTIDLDIVLFNRQILNLAHSRIPDPDLFERPFMAVTLAEIAPDYRHPETGQTLQDIAAKFVLNADEMRLHPDVSQALQAVRPNRALQGIIN
jgi:2-amino-4-hydroxy-6-hydroxymethyldihydropteridine diphosphokinase